MYFSPAFIAAAAPFLAATVQAAAPRVPHAIAQRQAMPMPYGNGSNSNGDPGVNATLVTSNDDPEVNGTATYIDPPNGANRTSTAVYVPFSCTPTAQL
jgi:hypothetical protein